MTPIEAVALCRLAKACCPQQAFDELTADAWGLMLDDILFDQAKEALVAVAKRQPFVAPAEIRAEVKQVRYRNLDAYGGIQPLDGETYLEAQTAVADGRRVRSVAVEVLPEREMPSLTHVVRSLNEPA